MPAKINKQDLIDFLIGRGDWVEASVIADWFHVSSRSIRNYVASANEGCNPPPIVSSYKGYRYNSQTPQYDSSGQITETPEKRLRIEMQKIISAKVPIDFYQLAEELYISEATLERDIARARGEFESFGLILAREHNRLIIKGAERQKRKFIKHLVNTEEHGILPAAQIGLSAEMDSYSELNDYVPELLERFDIYADDFGLSNIIHHLKITLDRVQHGQSINEAAPVERLKGRKEYEVASCVGDFINTEYKIEMSEAELYYIALTITSNSNFLKYKIMDASNIHQFIEERYILLSKTIIKSLEETFYLEPFDDAFFVKFTIHVHNLLQRIHSDVKISNPLLSQIKVTYPLIYDMAVFVTNEIRKLEHIMITEDEIAFIAFHIGAYLEENKTSKKKINILFVYADYHNMHQPVLTKLQQRFSGEINVAAAVSLKELNNVMVKYDLIISAAEIADKKYLPVINISIFLTEQDIKAIRRQIQIITEENMAVQLKANLQRFAVLSLFKRDYYADDEFHMIRKLTDECYHLGYSNEKFQQEVLDREMTSSTSFHNSVAVPHSMNMNANRSFMSIVLNEIPMRWGSNNVQIIVLIGICKKDLVAFQEIFDKLIAVLSESAYTRKLVQSNSYNEFLNILTRFILEVK